MPKVGVLALQGDVREHATMLSQAGADVSLVKRAEQLDDLDGLIIPGGESTTIAYLLTTSGVRDALDKKINDGFNVLGTCAGLIMLSSGIEGGRSDQWSYNAIDVVVKRNGYGRQIASFETDIDVKGIGQVPGVFIRAPRVVSVGSNVEILATYDHGDGEHPVLMRQGNAWGCSFHPELTSDSRVHELFVKSL
jgi:pyridoxal 5'-phosphate synthase pdxT subunit